MFSHPLAELPELAPSDVLLVMPPFGGIDRPSLGLHLLQACAREAGFRVSVLYANLLLAAEMGYDLYEAICYAPTSDLLGERLFSSVAGFRNGAANAKPAGTYRTASARNPLRERGVEFGHLTELLDAWVERLCAQLAARETGVIGFNSTFEQTACAASIIRGIKRCRPDLRMLIGGANCEGEMAEGMASLIPEVDHIFSGESETTFVDWLKYHMGYDQRCPSRIVSGAPCRNLDALPTPDYSDYYYQLERCQKKNLIPATKHIWLPYEGSRGCWWGQKHHCTFCGINGQGMAFREKSAARVYSDLETLLSKHPTEKVLMVDNIMPSSYFTSLLPKLEGSPTPKHIFYEQKSNLTLAKVGLLRRSGVAVIQPGIEAISSSLLKRMKKGVKASQNIALLRYARAHELSVNWNLLYAFPGDEESEYEHTSALIDLIPHLHPPTGVCHLSIDRFSPYFDRAAEFGIEEVRPMDSYYDVLPDHIDCSKVAYHFIGDYDCAHKRNPRLIARIEEQVEHWRRNWMNSAKPPPGLAIEALGKDLYLLADTRATPSFTFITHEQAFLALVGARPETVPPRLRLWAEQTAKVALQLDGMLVPLATARPELLENFEKSRQPSQTQATPSVLQSVPAK
jgi:ribosomal peptide maturation radical SAM protein 1